MAVRKILTSFLGVIYLISLLATSTLGFVLPSEQNPRVYIVSNVILISIYLLMLLRLIKAYWPVAISIAIFCSAAVLRVHFSGWTAGGLGIEFLSKADALDIYSIAVPLFGFAVVYLIWIKHFPTDRAHLWSWLGWTWFILFDWCAAFLLVEGWWWVSHIGVAVAGCLWIVACVYSKKTQDQP